jgi:hypothetical protein
MDNQSPVDKKKTTGGKDNKLVKKNKNITSALSNRSREQALEAEATKEIAERQESGFTPQQRITLELIGLGWSIEQVGFKNKQMLVDYKKVIQSNTGIHRVPLPSRDSIYRWKREQPEFAEAIDQVYNNYIDSCAMETIKEAQSLPKFKGLKPFQRALMTDKMIGRKLQIAGVRIPRKWSDQSDDTAEVIVMEVSGGWVPTNTAQGSPGQGDGSSDAKDRWRKLDAADVEVVKDN